MSGVHIVGTVGTLDISNVDLSTAPEFKNRPKLLYPQLTATDELSQLTSDELANEERAKKELTTSIEE